ncbi:hypothetical protein [Desulfobotulus sp.]|nr:hypothetical protein [Desulfobotulus sp.]MDY0164795.1 hypothetical protein [Desulfobotulus sp.]
MKTDALEMLSRNYEQCGKALERARQDAERRKLIREQVFRKTHQK